MAAAVLSFATTVSGCAGSVGPDECPTQLVSEFEVNGGALSSGETAIAVQWSRQQGFTRPEYHGAMLLADRTVTADISVETDLAVGVPGTRTVVWLPDPKPNGPFEITLARIDGTFERTVLHPRTRLRLATFDGTSFQLFWTNETGIYHQSLSENGVFGAVHQLNALDTVVMPASSNAGATLLRIDATIYLLDTQTGALTSVLGNALSVEEVVFFAGQFRLRDGVELISITPAGVVTRTPLPLHDATAFHATANRLLAEDASGYIWEIDANLALASRVGSTRDRVRATALLGSEFVQLEYWGKDFASHDPAHVDLVGPQWRMQLAVDSPVREVSSCDPR